MHFHGPFNLQTLEKCEFKHCNGKKKKKNPGIFLQIATFPSAKQTKTNHSTVTPTRIAVLTGFLVI